MKIYVASSWRNRDQQFVVQVLRLDGHQVYDFRDHGFHWTDVDHAWQQWPSDIPKYLSGLEHPQAVRGFNRDMTALLECDACVYVMPCGVSASLEAGWACGAGKPVFIYVPELREAELMVKMATMITHDITVIQRELRSLAALATVAQVGAEKGGRMTAVGSGVRAKNRSILAHL